MIEAAAPEPVNSGAALKRGRNPSLPTAHLVPAGSAGGGVAPAKPSRDGSHALYSGQNGAVESNDLAVSPRTARRASIRPLPKHSS
jgi:hypothetical protein